MAEKTLEQRIMEAADNYYASERWAVADRITMADNRVEAYRATLAALVAEACASVKGAPRARLALARFGALIVREYSRTDYGFIRVNGPQLDWAAYHAGVTVEKFGDLAPGIWAEGDALIQGMADGQEVTDG